MPHATCEIGVGVPACCVLCMDFLCTPDLIVATLHVLVRRAVYSRG